VLRKHHAGRVRWPHDKHVPHPMGGGRGILFELRLRSGTWTCR
jgi:hypothetical protein